MMTSATVLYIVHSFLFFSSTMISISFSSCKQMRLRRKGL
jgi:hypothetical protein